MLEIIYFLIVSFMLGLTARKLLYTDFAEELTAKLLFGVCLLSVVSVWVGFVSGISLITVFLISTALMLIFSDFHKFKVMKILYSNNIIYVWGFAIIIFSVFYYGASMQFWLEDGDPNGFAEAISYIAHYHTFLKPNTMFIARYMEPYPVGFQCLLGLLASDTFDISGTMKLINSVLIAFAIPALYLLMRGLGFKSTPSLCGAFILMAIPSFSTRFIFAQSLSMIQMLMGFYFLSRSKDNKVAGIYSGICFGALCITHQTTGVVAVGLGILWVFSDLIANKKFTYGYVGLVVTCLLISAPWWGFEYSKYGTEKILYQLNLGKLGETVFGLSDPSLKMYTISDLFVSPIRNSIDNATGFGAVIFILGGLSLVAMIATYKRQFTYTLLLSWIILLMLALFSNHLPISFIPSRMWVYVSIPLSMIAGWGLSAIYKDKKYEVSTAVALVFVIGIVVFSFIPKYNINTVEWGSSRFTTDDEYNMADFVFNLPIGTNVIDACFYERVWGLNKWDDPRADGIILLKNSKVNTSIYGWDSEGWMSPFNAEDSFILSGDPVKLHEILVSAGGYKYMIMGSRCMQIGGFDSNNLKGRVNQLVASGGFSIAYSSGDEYVVGVK